MTSGSRPRLLFLAHLLPYPPESGAAVRTYHMLRILAERFEVTALCFCRGAPEAGADSSLSERLARLGALGIAARAFPIPQEGRPARLVWDHVRSLIRRRAYTWYTYDSRGYQEALSQALASAPPALVHLDSLDLAACLPLLGGSRVIIGHHNLESDLLSRRALGESGITGLYFRHQAGLLAAQEVRWCPTAALNVMVSERDVHRLRERVPAARCVVIPNGVDTEYFRPRDVPTEGLVFVGASSWRPNLDAMEYLATKIAPELARLDVSGGITWVGETAPADRVRFRNAPAFHLTGRLPDIRPAIAASACYVVPLRIGGGTRVKILDAWAMGKAVVSTSIGCEGLDAVDGDNILIRDDPRDFALAVRDVLRDSSLRERLGQRARATAVSRYSWTRLAPDLLRHYAEAMKPD